MARNPREATQPRVSAFTGLNNVADPLDVGLGGQVQADNVIVTKDQHLRRMQGYVLSVDGTAIAGAYATKDFTRLYVIDSGSLLQVYDDLSTLALRTGLSAGDYHFDEVNGVVFYTNGTDYGTITPGGAGPWGIAAPDAAELSVGNAGTLRAGTYQFVCTLVDPNGLESSNSDVAYVDVGDGARITVTIPQVDGFTTNVYVATPADPVFCLMLEAAGTTATFDDQYDLGTELPFWNLNPPRGILPTYFAGKMHTAEYDPISDTTTIWNSLPLQYHHFDPGAEGVIIPGEVRQMLAMRDSDFFASERLTQRGIGAAMIVGTDREIYSYDEEQLVLLAPYGVLPGHHAVEYRGKVYMWTLRGMVRALPFENLTEKTVSVAPGVSAAGTVIEQAGAHRYVVALHKGGEAFNHL